MEERELPVGWATARLEELISNDGLLSDGDWVESKDQDPEGKIRLLQLADIGDSIFLDKSQRFVNNEQYERLRCTEVLEGDILIARMPDPLGRACLVPALGQRMITVVDVAIVRPGQDSVMPKWLMYVINAPQIRGSIELQSTGTTRRRITRKKLSALEFQIAPLNEQRRIAAKLDTTLAAVDACRQRLDGVAAILKRFRQAVLAAATSGELTREWREDHPDDIDASSLAAFLKSSHSLAGGHKRGNAAPPTDGVHDLDEQDFPEGWRLVELRDIVRPDRPITYGILKPGPELVDGVPYIRVADFPGDRLSLDGIRKTSVEIDQAYKRSRLAAGDLLLSIRGTVGRLISIPPELEGANITQDTARLSVQEELSVSYVKYALHSELLQSRMRRAVKGVAVRGINIGDVRALQIPLPSIQEQEEIVRQVDSLIFFSGQLEARLKSAQNVVDRLTPALLAKAFRGELVPQDPGDEPASVLLERIRAARQAEAGAGKPSRRGRPKAAANLEPIHRNAHPAPSDPLPPDLLTQLLRECGALSERALLAVSELEPERFEQQLFRELEKGTAREVQANGQVLLEAVG